jgi:dolichol kinase
MLALDRGSGYNRLARKLLHVAGGLPALLLPYLPYWLVLAGAAAGVVLAFMLKPTHGKWLRTITKPIDRRRGVISGVRGYFTAVLALVLLWPLLRLWGVDGSVRYIMFGWLALALGDGLAGILGPGPRRGNTVPWNNQKTWWGVAGCFIGTLGGFVVSFGLPLESSVGQLPVLPLVLLGALASITVAVGESAELPADDNYVVGLSAPVVALLVIGLWRLAG